MSAGDGHGGYWGQTKPATATTVGTPGNEKTQPLDQNGGLVAPGGNGTLPYVSPDSNSYASDTLANLYRAQWQDYKTRFQPYEKKLEGMVGNQQETDRLRGMAGDSVDSAFGLADSNYQQRLQQYGLSSTGVQATAHDTTSALAKTAGKVDAYNNLRDHLSDRDNMIIAGGLGDVLSTSAINGNGG